MNIAPPISTDPSHPRRVPDNDIRAVSREIQFARGFAESVAREGSTTPVPPIAVPAPPGCAKVADGPFGAVRRDGQLNGRTTAFDCGAYALTVDRMEFSAPQKGALTLGFPPSQQTAVVNGGALSRHFKDNSVGRRSISYVWIGRDRSATVTMVSERASFPDMVKIGDAYVDALTRR